MLALPLLTERATGFTGCVYATYAALQLGTQLMLEMARMQTKPLTPAQTGSAPHPAAAPTHAPAPPTPGSAPPAPEAVVAFLRAVWARGQPAYTDAEARACASRIAAISYGQNVRLTPDGSVVASASPSGSSIGGACWALDAHGCQLAVMCEPSVPAAADLARWVAHSPERRGGGVCR
jgi:hypothetical protein